MLRQLPVHGQVYGALIGKPVLSVNSIFILLRQGAMRSKIILLTGEVWVFPVGVTAGLGASSLQDLIPLQEASIGLLASLPDTIV